MESASASLSHQSLALLDLPESIFDSILDRLDASIICHVLRPSCSQFRSRLNEEWWMQYCERTFSSQLGFDCNLSSSVSGSAMHTALRYCAFQTLQGVKWKRLPDFPLSSEGHAGAAVGHNVWVSLQHALRCSPRAPRD
jgi:hypothetical protein